MSGADRGGRSGFFRIDAQTGAASVLVSGERLLAVQPRLAWSPDGTTFRFQREASTAGIAKVMEVELASGVEREFYNGPISGPVRTSRDQQTLYYRSGPTGDSMLVARNRLTGQERVLARGVTAWGFLSRDDRYVSIGKTDGETGLRSAGIVDTASGQYREVFRGGAPAESVGIGIWAPDGRSLLVSKGLAAGSSERWWVPIDARQPRRLTELGGGDSGIEIHPDGRQVLFTRQMPEIPAEVWVLENFLPAAVRR